MSAHVAIQLTRGAVALVDAEDAERVRRHSWCLHVNRDGVNRYAKAKVSGRFVTLHRFILQAPAGSMVDHRNHDGLDNRRENLRFCSREQNMQNRVTTARTRRGEFKGVSRRPYGGFSASIQANGENRWLGTFSTARDAALAYDFAARQAFGDFASVNFPDIIATAVPAGRVAREAKDTIKNRRRRLRAAAGLCAECGKPALGKRLCPPHHARSLATKLRSKRARMAEIQGVGQ